LESGSAAQQAGSSTEEDQLKTCIKGIFRSSVLLNSSPLKIPGIVDCVLEVIQSDDVFEDEDPFAGLKSLLLSLWFWTLLVNFDQVVTGRATLPSQPRISCCNIVQS
jgi:hypothetical protein